MEARVGMIRNVPVETAMGQKFYDVVLTDRRTIFVLRRTPHDAAGAAVGSFVPVVGAPIGRAIGRALSPTRDVDVLHTDPATLAADPRNSVVPHESIRSLALVKKWGAHVLLIRYATPEGKGKKVKAFLRVPREVVRAASNKASASGRPNAHTWPSSGIRFCGRSRRTSLRGRNGGSDPPRSGIRFGFPRTRQADERAPPLVAGATAAPPPWSPANLGPPSPPR